MDKKKVIILGAGRPHFGIMPASLVYTSASQRVLDWQIDAYMDTLNIDESKITFIGGYNISDIIEKYPQLDYKINKKWNEAGIVKSLLCADILESEEYFISYSDIIFSKKIVRLLTEIDADIVLACDIKWKNQFKIKEKKFKTKFEQILIRENEKYDFSYEFPENVKSSEFVGLMKFSGKVGKYISKLRENVEYQKMNIPELVIELQKMGLTVKTVQVTDGWAELVTPYDLSKFIFSTKGKTLESLQSIVKNSIIGDQIRFNIKMWNESKQNIIKNIKHRFDNEELAVRSCSMMEDGWEESSAGCYESLLNVSSSKNVYIEQAIEKVIASYGENSSIKNEVFIQKMVKDVSISGVVLTRSLGHGAPYYIINYDDISNRTDSVTSGNSENLKTMIVLKKQYKKIKEINNKIYKLLIAIKELEMLVCLDAIDIEFIIDKRNNIHILQLRPITTTRRYKIYSDEEVETVIENAVAYFKMRQQKYPNVLGNKTIYGVMPDWNPAEIIGVIPKLLSKSLYEYIIMINVWAQQRAEFGYRDVRPNCLLIDFAGHAYVDVRACFNSYIPKNLPKELAEKMILYYMRKMEDNPYLHDKVEFDIVFTCFDFAFDIEGKNDLYIYGFKQEEISRFKKELIEITKNSWNRIDKDLKQIEFLKIDYGKIKNLKVSELEKVYFLLEDCKKNGSIAFAHLARSAFIAIRILDSLVKVKAITKNEKEKFLYTISTVAKEMNLDAYMVKSGVMDICDFIEKYGHLRPGTYEITSPAYKDNVKLFIEPIINNSKKQEKIRTEKIFSDESILNINKLLEKYDFGINFEELIEFFRKAIEGREYAKFIFTKNISLALDLIKIFAQNNKIEVEDIAYLSINDLLLLNNSSRSINFRKMLLDKIESEKYVYNLSQSIELPPLITNENDFYYFCYNADLPNYVSSKSIITEIIEITSNDIGNSELKGKLVMLPNADPGFDWVFSCEIGGLLTKYGGVNSHMTIRAAELGLPAAIGLGEQQYTFLQKADLVSLDCRLKKIEVLQWKRM